MRQVVSILCALVLCSLSGCASQPQRHVEHVMTIESNTDVSNLAFHTQTSGGGDPDKMSVKAMYTLKITQ